MEPYFKEEHHVVGRGHKFRVLYTPCTSGEGLVILHHGIGSSALTFALMVRSFAQLWPGVGFLAFDARHHGLTESLEARDSLDLSLGTLVEDCEFVVNTMMPEGINAPVLLVGHSMGGTVVTTIANNKTFPNVRGVSVLDAVEGYARESLKGMNRLLSLWPASFTSPEQAISWHVGRGHQIRNPESAKISVPPLVKYDEKEGAWVWRLDLDKTEKDWQSWFQGLDEKFLSAPAARLLILAGAGRLDKALTVGQMQGKYQLAVFNECGHYLHEDNPDGVARVLFEFWQRNGKPLQITPKFGKMRS